MLTKWAKPNPPSHTPSTTSPKTSPKTSNAPTGISSKLSTRPSISPSKPIPRTHPLTKSQSVRIRCQIRWCFQMHHESLRKVRGWSCLQHPSCRTGYHWICQWIGSSRSHCNCLNPIWRLHLSSFRPDRQWSSQIQVQIRRAVWCWVAYYQINLGGCWSWSSLSLPIALGLLCSYSRAESSCSERSHPGQRIASSLN